MPELDWLLDEIDEWDEDAPLDRLAAPEAAAEPHPDFSDLMY